MEPSNEGEISFPFAKSPFQPMVTEKDGDVVINIDPKSRACDSSQMLMVNFIYLIERKIKIKIKKLKN